MNKSYGFMRRAIAFAGAVIITVNIAAAPQRARAVAVTASVVASVAAIMTACGVTYWAASQTEAIDYLGGRIDAYLGSLETVPQSYEDWLGIDAASQLFEVTASGTMRFASGVANKILDFTRWYNDSEGITSGGSAVTAGGLGIAQVNQYQTPQGTVDAAFNGDVITFVFTGYGAPNNYFTTTIPLSVPVGATVSATCVASNLSYNEQNMSSTIRFGVDFTDSASTLWFYGGSHFTSVDHSVRTTRADGDGEYLALTCNTGSNLYNGTLSFRISGDDVNAAPTAAVTPTAVVSVPDNMADNDSFAVTPSVSLTPGMTVDQASEAVLDGVASEDGLTSEGETAGGAAAGWGWLADLLERIRQAVQGTHEVAQGTQETVQGMQEAVEGTQQAVEGTQEAVEGMQEAVEGTQQAVEGTQEAVEGMQEAVEGIERAVQPAQYSAIGSYQLNLTNFFPFCIPWDLFRGLSLLVADPVAPSIDWEVPLPNGSTYTLSLDFSEFDGVAQVARTMELLAFVVALAVATKKLIKW